MLAVEEMSAVCFNPRPRAGGDISGSPLKYARLLFQSTPPRGGRQCIYCRRGIGEDVSIHAPARGATEDYEFPAQLKFVSIHAPARGATRRRISSVKSSGQFQSTPPRGGRRRWPLRLCRRPQVSIHAPARGATRGVYYHSCFWICFNPRPRAGGDAFPITFILPRATVSIHAPARGATSQRIVFESQQGFQSTPPRGGRPGEIVDSVPCSFCFNPRPRAGGDSNSAGVRSISRCFNPRPRAGGD